MNEALKALLPSLGWENTPDSKDIHLVIIIVKVVGHVPRGCSEVSNKAVDV